MNTSCKNDLICQTETEIRFSEVDSMRVVWHGNYVKYLEDGREAFGRKFGIGYLDVSNRNYTIPIVKVDIDYKRSVLYGDRIIIETRYVNSEAAKIIFDYTIYRKSDNKVAMKARTIQVFLDQKGQLELNCPDFYMEWKQKWGLLDT